MPIDIANRCFSHIIPLAKRKQKLHHAQHDCQNSKTPSPAQGVFDFTTHPRHKKSQSRLPQQKSRLQGLPPQPHHSQTNVPPLQLLANSGPVCQQTQQTDNQLLQLENGQTQQGQCFPNQLGQAIQLAQSTMGIDSQVLEQIDGGQGHSIGMPSLLDSCTLVPPVARNDDQTTHDHQKPSNVSKSRRKFVPTTTLGNPFHHHPRLTTAQLKQTLRTLETQNDISHKQRVQWVIQAKAFYPNPDQQIALTQCVKRLQKAQHKPKYPIFFNIDPILQLAFPKNESIDSHTQMNQDMSTIPLVDKLILQLRLTTLMRSIDVANITWALFHMEGKHYIKTTNKQGQSLTFSVNGATLNTLINYMFLHVDHPAPFMIRYTHNKHMCMGAERIAKRTLQIMQKAGVEIEIYKAHSLRGATATHMLQAGTPQTLVMARGGGPRHKRWTCITTGCISKLIGRTKSWGNMQEKSILQTLLWLRRRLPNRSRRRKTEGVESSLETQQRLQH